MPILGLTLTESLADARFKNVRRQVFYSYPNGKLPLVGLLSLLGEEPTNDPEFKWFERRMVFRTVTGKRASNLGPWLNEAGSSDISSMNVDGTTLYQLQVTSDTASDLQAKVGDIIQIDVYSGASAYKTVLVNVTSVGTYDSGAKTYKLKVRPLCFPNGSTGTATVANASCDGKTGYCVTAASGEGAAGPGELSFTPLEASNYTQIVRTSFSLTGTALHTAVKWDERGPYRDLAKEAAVNHMAALERAFLFGARDQYWSADSGVLIRMTGGVLYFLRQWELGSSAAIKYRTGADISSQDYTNDEKRVIDLSSAPITERIYDTLLERVFRVSNNVTNEKLALCGNQALNVINQLYKTKSCLTADLPLGDTYGMQVVKHVTPFGTLYYKTHPLFNESALYRGSILIVDVHNLRYRYVTGRDTQLIKSRQNPNEDLRRDEWLTEAGLELRFPESHMYISGVTDFLP